MKFEILKEKSTGKKVAVAISLTGKVQDWPMNSNFEFLGTENAGSEDDALKAYDRTHSSTDAK